MQPSLFNYKTIHAVGPLKQARVRLRVVSLCFVGLFGGLALRSTQLILFPSHSALSAGNRQVDQTTEAVVEDDSQSSFRLMNTHRSPITDRNGTILAVSTPAQVLYADPYKVYAPEQTAKALKRIFPEISLQDTLRRLKSKKRFVYIKRGISSQEARQVNNIGNPGLHLEKSEKREYPMRRLAAHLLGAVDVDDNGIAGIEKAYNDRLKDDTSPLALSIDIRAQAALQDELSRAQEKFHAAGGAAILMEVHTGEVIAMTSLPDYDANDFSKATDQQRFNRPVSGVYEPGSTLKVQTVAMGLEDKTIHLWDSFSVEPIKVQRFTIKDLATDHFTPYLTVPEILAYSSNPGAARISWLTGTERQQEWLHKMGFADRVPFDLPEGAHPLLPKPDHWKEAATLTIGFGHGLAVTPLALTRGLCAVVNGGYLPRPTLMLPGDNSPMSVSTKVLSARNSLVMRKLLRLTVTKGVGKKAESEGYFVGGKTGTAEKIDAHGRYMRNVNITAFTGAFPMNNPKYALYVMLDAPHGTADTYGLRTAGWIVAPVFSRIVSRVAPMLDIYPELQDEEAIDKSLNISLHPFPPPGAHPYGPGNDPTTHMLP